MRLSLRRALLQVTVAIASCSSAAVSRGDLLLRGPSLLKVGKVGIFLITIFDF